MKKPAKPLRMPPKTTSSERDEALDAFAAGADYPSKENTGESSAGSRRGLNIKDLPWEAPGVRKDVIKSYALRIPEPMYLKLKFIAENTPYSMNSFISEKIAEAIEEDLALLLGRQYPSG
ncbi:MAG: hypothetical protein A2464_06110 [Deltaproteobacteria bacterium RIFOXYC2_FULL_48_10]|nr:MAG: hypothetical protein A2464_06110 [Deltaproteobacteria bacterium RIFOXYC2_FULL_48_10]